ncbi:MAG: hypothetical protein ACOC0D_05080 [Spirochaeta sp.]
MKASTTRLIRNSLLAIMILLPAILLPAQRTVDTIAQVQSPPSQSTADSEVFFPFISSLRIATRAEEVRLSWRDVPNYDGNYHLFRHTNTIHEQNLQDAVRIAAVPQGEEEYTDTPPEPGEFYYAVLTEKRDGSPLAVFIPFRNQTVQPVQVDFTAPVQAAVTGLTITQESDRVILEFNASTEDRSLAVVRSTEPIRSSDDAGEATLIDLIEGGQRRVIDVPPLGVSYYYGVFDAQTIGTDDLRIEIGENVSEQAIALPLPELPDEAPPSIAEPEPEVPEEPVPDETPVPDEPTITGAPQITRTGSTGQQSRSNPLPLLQSRFSVLQDAQIDSFPVTIPRRRQIADATREAIHRIQENIPPAADMVLPEPHILNGDNAMSLSSTRLREIVEGSFSNERWNQAYAELTELLASPISRELEQHARFYRGQSLFFLEYYQEAFLELLTVRESFYAEAAPFIDTSLQLLQESAGEL